MQPTIMRQETESVSLFGIESSILELLSFRQDVLERLALLQADADAIEERQEACAELDACDRELRRLAGAEASKVNSCASIIRGLESIVAHRKDERDRHNRAAKRAEAMLDFMHNVVMEALTLSGETRFVTPTNTLRMQRNPAKVEITDYSAVQDRFVKVLIETTVDRWKQMKEAQPDLVPFFNEKGDRTFALAAIAKVIKAALNADTLIDQKAGTEGWTPKRIAEEKKQVERVRGARLIHEKHLRVE